MARTYKRDGSGRFAGGGGGGGGGGKSGGGKAGKPSGLRKKVKVDVKKPIGYRISDIGPGKKEYNVKTGISGKLGEAGGKSKVGATKAARTLKPGGRAAVKAANKATMDRIESKGLYSSGPRLATKSRALFQGSKRIKDSNARLLQNTGAESFSSVAAGRSSKRISNIVSAKGGSKGRATGTRSATIASKKAALVKKVSAASLAGKKVSPAQKSYVAAQQKAKVMAAFKASGKGSKAARRRK